MSQVAAFCWNRSPSVPASWLAFLDGPHESHHLPDQKLRTRPDTAGAGWVKALTKAEHHVEHDRLEAARLAAARVRLLEEEERRAARQMRLSGALQQASARRAGTALASIAARRVDARRRAGVSRGVRQAGQELLTSWDVDWNTVAGGGPSPKELEDNPYLVWLFVEYDKTPGEPEWRRKRSAWLAQCTQVAYLQARGGADYQTPPWLLYIAERLEATKPWE